jgi:hypothetical protein
LTLGTPRLAELGEGRVQRERRVGEDGIDRTRVAGLDARRFRFDRGDGAVDGIGVPAAQVGARRGPGKARAGSSAATTRPSSSLRRMSFFFMLDAGSLRAKLPAANASGR